MAPCSRPGIALLFRTLTASIVLLRKSSSAWRTCASVALVCSVILASDSLMRITASSCAEVRGLRQRHGSGEAVHGTCGRGAPLAAAGLLLHGRAALQRPWRTCRTVMGMAGMSLPSAPAARLASARSSTYLVRAGESGVGMGWG